MMVPVPVPSVTFRLMMAPVPFVSLSRRCRFLKAPVGTHIDDSVGIGELTNRIAQDSLLDGYVSTLRVAFLALAMNYDSCCQLAGRNMSQCGLLV